MEIESTRVARVLDVDVAEMMGASQQHVERTNTDVTMHTDRQDPIKRLRDKTNRKYRNRDMETD